MSGKTPCPQGCGANLSRHQVKGHLKRYCQSNGAPGLQPKRCENPGRACPVSFVPPTGNPNQKYCSRVCSGEADVLRRARAPKTSEPEPSLSSEEARDAQQMASVRIKEAEAAALVEYANPAIIAANETNTGRWLALLGVAYG